MDIKQVQELLVNNQIDWLIHLSALLSAVGKTDIFLITENSALLSLP